MRGTAVDAKLVTHRIDSRHSTRIPYLSPRFPFSPNGPGESEVALLLLTSAENIGPLLVFLSSFQSFLSLNTPQQLVRASVIPPNSFSKKRLFFVNPFISAPQVTPKQNAIKSFTRFPFSPSFSWLPRELPGNKFDSYRRDS